MLSKISKNRNRDLGIDERIYGFQFVGERPEREKGVIGKAISDDGRGGRPLVNVLV